MNLAQQVLFMCEEVAPSGAVVPLKGEKCPNGYEQNPKNPNQCVRKKNLLKAAIGGYAAYHGGKAAVNALKSMKDKKKFGLLDTVKLGAGAAVALAGAKATQRGLGMS